MSGLLKHARHQSQGRKSVVGAEQQDSSCEGIFMAVMWGAALVRVLGPDAAEVPVVATRPQLRNRGLARKLLAALEESLKASGVARIAMPGIRAPGLHCLSLMALPASQGFCNLLV